MIRPLLMTLVVLTASFVTFKFSYHHPAGKTPFETLYMHLVPAPVGKTVHSEKEVEYVDEDGNTQTRVEEVHDFEPLVMIELPEALKGFDAFPDDNTVTVASDGKVEDAGPWHLTIQNLQVFQLAAILLILIGFSGVPTYLRTGQGDRVTKILTGFCLYVRDEMIIPNVGKEHGTKLLPLFFSVFFFILFMNLCGLVPGSVTPTASIFVTAALAMITLCCMIGGGMMVQGPVAYWKHLVPHVPAWLWPLLFVIEVIGVLVKPFALMIRLFANLTGGHMVVLSFMGLIFFFGQTFGSSIGYASAPVAIGFAVFIMIIEGFVAFVQAYVFTLLSAIFVGGSLHPEH